MQGTHNTHDVLINCSEYVPLLDLLSVVEMNVPDVTALYV